jgi:hypothetical protein
VQLQDESLHGGRVHAGWRWRGRVAELEPEESRGRQRRRQSYSRIAAVCSVRYY